MGKRVDVYGALTHGAEEGLTVLLKVLPALVGLLTAVAMFRASGALEWLTGLCAPALEFLGIPPETTPLMLVRPVSGSGALAVGSDLIAVSYTHLHRQEYWIISISAGDFTFPVFAYTYTKVLFI